MGASLNNLETRVGQLAHSMKESSFRSFLSHMEKNMKDCKAITLWSEKELGNSKNDENGKVENEKIVDEEIDNKIENEKVETEKQEV